MDARPERGTELERRMDERLQADGLRRRKIAKDGSCLFRAVAEQVLRCQGLHTKVRAECVKYLRQERSSYESFIEGDFEEYLRRLQDPQSWVGQVEITALSVLYKHDFIIYQQPDEPPVNITENGYPDKVRLCFLNGNHYDSVYPLSYTTNAAICQSILYELLYERVFRVDRGALASNMRSSKARDEDTRAEDDRSSDDSDLDDGDDFWSGDVTGRSSSVSRRAPYKARGRGQARGGGRGYLPRKVQDSLNPAYFRNVEYDAWLRSKKAQQRRDFCMAAGMHYAAGDKCQVRVRNDGPYYSAYIQDVSPDDGPVTVFIEELGERYTVPLWNLRTPSEESWCTVTDKGKRHSVSNGNAPTNEWETRGVRKLVHSVSGPHTAQATAGSAPSSRVQKQHSWPPQVPAEARPLGRSASGRKADQGGTALSHVQEEDVLLQLLHKDENNFPTLEASAQAACNEGSKRAERKGSRKKADTELKDQSPRRPQKTDRASHGKKSGVDQDPRICPSPPCSPPPAAAPAPKATKPAPAAPASAQTTPARSRTAPEPPTSTQTTTTQPQTAPLVARTALAQSQTATPVTAAPTTSPHTRVAQRVKPVSTPPACDTPTPSQTVSLTPATPSTTAPAPSPPLSAPGSTTAPAPSPPLSAPVSTTVPTAVIHHTVSVPSPLPAPGQNPDVAPPPPPASAPALATARGPEPSPVMPPARAPLAVPVAPPPQDPDLPPAPLALSAPPAVPAAVFAPLPATPPAQPPCSVAPFHPVGLGMQPPFPPYPPHPASGAVPTPPPVTPSAQTPPFPHPAEPRPYDPAALVAGAGPAAVPDYQTVQRAFALPHPFSHDPLYPGFPRTEEDHAFLQPPALSLHHTGKDLPKDMNVLRWFFNLGVKAYTNPMWAPLTYLTPLTQAYNMQLKAPPTTSSLYTPQWPPDQNSASLPHMGPAPSHSPMGPPVAAGGGPIGHFEVRGVTPMPPPVEVGGYSGHLHSVPMAMPPRPAVPWSAAHHPPHVFPGVYSLPPPGSVPFSIPPPGGEGYQPASAGHQRHSVPPPLNRRIDVTTATGTMVTERGEGGGQRSTTPQTEKPTWSGGSHLQPGGGDMKPAIVPVAMPTMEPQHGGGASPVPAVLIGGAVGERADPTELANGNTKEDDFTKRFQGGACGEALSPHTTPPSTHTPRSTGEDWEIEDVEYGDPDLRSGRFYYSQSFKSGGRRGQEDRGGYRGGGFRGRRDYSGRSRQYNQSVYHRVPRGRGRGRGYAPHSNAREAGYAGGQFASSHET